MNHAPPVRSPGGILFDLEGTLHIGDQAISGAPEAIAHLARLAIPTRFITNTTRYSRAELATRLKAMGFSLEEDEIFTAPRSAAEWLRGRSLSRVMLCLPESTRGDFSGFDLVEDGAQAVVVGDLGREWTFDRLNAAFRALLQGAVLVALQKNRYWRTDDGLTLDAGPFVAALEHAANTTAVLVGKPSPDFFLLAADSLGVAADDVLVAGDDVEADVGGAQSAGMRGVLVRTGKFSYEALTRSGITPDEIHDSIKSLVDSLASAPGISSGAATAIK